MKGIGCLLPLVLFTQLLHMVATSPPPANHSRGIDVSKWQNLKGEIDWERAKADGVEFAIIRSSQGLGYSDPYFKANWDGASAAGIVTHVYHYFIADLNASSATEVV